MGWRVGGKGASGRNLDIAERIEEHGLHIWFGFYENAFRLIRQCYDELGRDPSEPMATWQDAFKPHHLVALQEQVNGEWQQWAMEMPDNVGLPGDGGQELTPSDWVRSLLQVSRQMIRMFFSFSLISGQNGTNDSVIKNIGRASFSSVMMLLSLADKASNETVGRLGQALPFINSSTAGNISDARQAIWDGLHDWIEQSDETRRLWIILDLTLTVLYGILKDKLLERGFGSIDRYDFAEWLTMHGASPMTVRSAPIRSVYDMAFAYENGDIEKPNFAAGASLRGYLRGLFSYKGAFMWKMQAGMGDIVFTPIYEVLKRRGVHFKFFHRVENLGLSADGKSIATMRMARQATLKEDEYQPLIDVKGLPCWPDRPLYDQLVEGEELKANKINLECSWSPQKPAEILTLQKGQDFDEVVLGISIAALPHICGEIIESRKAWQRMIENVKTVQTLAFQTWLKPTAREMGWDAPTRTNEGPIQCAYVEPIDTWADLSYLAEKENWPEEHTPGHIGYFCGPLNEPNPIAPFSDHGFHDREKARVREMMQGFFEKDAAYLWPDAVDPKTGGLDWNLLVDMEGRQGAARLDAQYHRANVEPTERYVLSLKGSMRYRLKPHESGVDNLFLAGDWTDNGMNSGCIEAAVMSGLLCARAVSGQDIFVYGLPRKYERPSLEPYHVLADCPNCGVVNAVVEWVDPSQPMGEAADTTCHFCGRQERGGVLTDAGKPFVAVEEVLAVLRDWAEQAETADLDLFVRANFCGLSANEVAQRVLLQRPIATSFHTLNWMLGTGLDLGSKDKQEFVEAQALTTIALADGIMKDEEADFIQSYLEKVGASALVAEDVRPWLPNDLPAPRHPQKLLQAMLELGWIDSQLTDKEWATIKEYAMAWHFSLADLEYMSTKLEREHISLMRRVWLRLKVDDRFQASSRTDEKVKVIA